MSRETKITAIPPIPPLTDRQLSKTLTAMKEALEVRVGHRGDSLDKAVTFRDLAESGMITIPVGVKASGTTLKVNQNPGDLSIPPAPRDLAAAPTFSHVLLTWEGGFLHPLVGVTEIFRHTSNNLNDAVQIDAVPNGAKMYTDTVAPGTTHYYWVRFRSPANVPGPFNATDGVVGTTSKKVSDLIGDLNDAIGETELSTALKAEIDKIEPLTGLQDTAETIETLLGQAQSSNSAVEILRDAINDELGDITVDWQGTDGTGGLQADINDLMDDGEDLRDEINTSVTTNTTSWQGSDGNGGIKAQITTNLGNATNLKTGISGEVSSKTITWEGSDGNGGIKADIATGIVNASNLKSGINAEVSTKTITWEGSDGNGGIKADLAGEILSATNLKTGIDSEVSSKTISWQGSDGNGGIKADISTELTTATNLKTGIDTEVNSQTISWQGNDGNGGVKAQISAELVSATSLKNGIDAEVNTRTITWEGSDGNGGIKADISTELTSATNLKTGIDAEVNSKTISWEGSDGNGGVQAQLTTALSNATNLKTGMVNTYDEKYLAWEGNGGSVTGIKNEIITVEEFFADLPTNFLSDVETFQTNWGGDTVSSVLTSQGTIINGLTTQQFVKTDVNGNVAGYGLYNSSTFSEFAINADVFKIANGSTSVQPFVVVTGAGLTVGENGTQYANTTQAWQQANHPAGKWFGPGTHIDTALIADASIDSAKISNLSVDFANITGALSANQMAAINIDAGQITGGSINGITITGGRINSGSAIIEDGDIEGAYIKGGVIEGAFILSSQNALVTEAGVPHYAYRIGVTDSKTVNGSTYAKAVLGIRPYNYQYTSTPTVTGSTYGNNYYRYRRQNICGSSSTPPTASSKFYWSGSATQEQDGVTYSTDFFTVRIRKFIGANVVDTESFTFTGSTQHQSESDSLETRSYSLNINGFVFSTTVNYRAYTYEKLYEGYQYVLYADPQWVNFTVTAPSTFNFNTATATGWGFDIQVTAHRGSSTNLELTVSDEAENDY